MNFLMDITSIRNPDRIDHAIMSLCLALLFYTEPSNAGILIPLCVNFKKHSITDINPGLRLCLQMSDWQDNGA